MENPLADLTAAWDQLETDKAPYVLHDDRAFLELARPPTQFEHVDTSSLSGAKSTTLHLELLPIPFMGDLARASIYFLMINPGYRDSSPLEFEVEQRSDWRKARLANLKQFASMEYPFLCLDPRFEGLPGHVYWESRLRWLIQAFERKGAHRDEALMRTANVFCSLELIPYFTRRAPSGLLSGNAEDRLPSTNLMLDFVRRDLLARAQENNALVIVARQPNVWGLPPDENALTSAVVPQSGYFRLQVRDDILDWLGRRGLL